MEPFHQKGIQALCFLDENYLISVGTYEQNILVVWKIENAKNLDSKEIKPVASVLIDDLEEGEQSSTNAIIVNGNQPRFTDSKNAKFPDCDDPPYYFYTVGSNSTITCWMFDAESADCELTCAKIPKPEGMPSMNFLSAHYFHHLPMDFNNPNSFCSEDKMVGGLLLGCQDGSIMYYDHEEGFIDLAEPGLNSKASRVLDEQIGHVIIRQPKQETKPKPG